MIQLKLILASNLKSYRKAKGLTQEKLAEKVNTASTYIAMIESARRTPSFTMIEKIACALEIEPAALFSLSSYPHESHAKLRGDLLRQFEIFLAAALKDTAARSPPE